MINQPSLTLLLLLAFSAILTGCSSETPQAPVSTESNEDKLDDPTKSILAERSELDETIWANEVEAQKHEMVFVGFWDDIRNATAKDRIQVIGDFPFTKQISVGKPSPPEQLESGIRLTPFSNEASQMMTPQEWKELITNFQNQGYQIIQTEWHHSRFIPATESSGAKSTISFSIHAVEVGSQTTCAFKGDLKVQWELGEQSIPIAESIAVQNLTLQQRSKGGIMSRLLSANYDSGDFVSAYPILVYDLDGNGLSEVIIPRWNRVYWNKGNREFEERAFLDYPIKIWEAGIISDFTGDGKIDFVTVGKDGKAHIFTGDGQGHFPNESVVCADVNFNLPTAVTAGDADGDGDLDLWMTQYKLSFIDGQMPTPYYDANDGYPSYYLVNDGTGNFKDMTEEAGLADLRLRRTYSSSFVDLDNDNDLDLMNVSDYAGLDIYENLGGGKFKLATEDYVDERNFFGMGHTIGDYNDDGLIDFYVIGMSSTTARRLDRLKLGRDDRPDVHTMRSTMGYGNRLYLGTNEKKFREDPKLAAAVARTGWSWGVTSFDFNLDGDLDIYVANGHRSGKSCQDYCTTFWRHDIYTGDSKENKEVLEVFELTLSDINKDEISWNGYEKNVLLLNHPEREGRFVNSSFMFGAAYSFDARCVISNDFDQDGWPDLVIAQSSWDANSGGFPLTIHVFGNDINTGDKNNWFAVQLQECEGPGFSPNGAKVTIEDNLGNQQTRWIVTGDSL